VVACRTLLRIDVVRLCQILNVRGVEAKAGSAGVRGNAGV